MPGDLTLDAPPQQPPSVSGAMGAGNEGSSMGGIAEMIRAQAGKGGPAGMASVAGTHPQGALITRIEAVEKVLTETARDNPPMANYVKRAMEILRTGMNEVIKMQKPGVVSTQPSEKGGSNAPPTGEAAKGFVG